MDNRIKLLTLAAVLCLIAWACLQFIPAWFTASSLSDFHGRTGTIFLRTDAAGMATSNTKGDGVHVVNGAAVSVSGNVTWASRRGVVVEWANRETWVPAEAIAAASFFKEVPEKWNPSWVFAPMTRISDLQISQIVDPK